MDREIPAGEWTPAMAIIAKYASDLAVRLLSAEITVSFYESVDTSVNPYWQGKQLCLAKQVGAMTALCALAVLIQSFGNRLAGNDESLKFVEECCRLGAELARLVSQERELLEDFVTAIYDTCHDEPN